MYRVSLRKSHPCSHVSCFGLFCFVFVVNYLFISFQNLLFFFAASQDCVTCPPSPASPPVVVTLVIDCAVQSCLRSSLSFFLLFLLLLPVSGGFGGSKSYFNLRGVMNVFTVSSVTSARRF